MSGSTNAPVPAEAPQPSARSYVSAEDLVDRLAGEVVLRHVGGQRVLDLGLGSPQIAQWVKARASSYAATSGEELGHRADIELDRPDASFDTVYCLRTLPHLGHDEASSPLAATSLLAEVGRVLVPGGVGLLQIDNPRSFWGLYHGVQRPLRAVERELVFENADGRLTRFETLGTFAGRLPVTLEVVHAHALSVLPPMPTFSRLPILGRRLERFEWWCRDSPLMRGFAAHILVVVRRHRVT